jgi:hypothetical protein
VAVEIYFSILAWTGRGRTGGKGWGLRSPEEEQEGVNIKMTLQ